MLSILKSKKTWILIIGLIIAMVAGFVCTRVLELSEEVTTQVIVFILGLVGVAEGGHIAADVVSMMKGLQKPKDSPPSPPTPAPPSP